MMNLCFFTVGIFIIFYVSMDAVKHIEYRCYIKQTYLIIGYFSPTLSCQASISQNSLWEIVLHCKMSGKIDNKQAVLDRGKYIMYILTPSNMPRSWLTESCDKLNYVPYKDMLKS